VHGDTRGRWDGSRCHHPELEQETQVVLQTPVLGHLPVVESVDMETRELDGQARGRDAAQCAQLGATPRDPQRHPVSLGDQILDGHLDIGKCDAERPNEALEALGTARCVGTGLVIEVV